MIAGSVENLAFWKKESSSYRMGFIEAMDGGPPNVYLLKSVAKDISDYNRGFDDGAAWKVSDERDLKPERNA